MRELHFSATALVWTVLSSAALAEPIDNPSTPKAAGRYDIAAFYWPSLHYDERWAEFFPGGGADGEWLAIFYDAPGGRQHQPYETPYRIGLAGSAVASASAIGVMEE